MEIGEGYSLTGVNYEHECVYVATEFDNFTIYKDLRMWGWVSKGWRVARVFHPVEYLKFMWDNIGYAGCYEPFLSHYQKTGVTIFAKDYLYRGTAVRTDIAFYVIINGQLKSYINPQTTEELC